MLIAHRDLAKSAHYPNRGALRRPRSFLETKARVGHNGAVKTAIVSLLGFVCGIGVIGCGGASYGYSRTYEPLSEEESYLADADVHLTYEEVRRAPRAHANAKLAWFGVVQEMHAVPCVKGLSQRELSDCQAGKKLMEVFLSYRTHRQRHLCSDANDSSCRVTVSDRDGGKVVARMSIPAEELEGDERIWRGSLLRIYGNPEVPENMPGPESLEVPDEEIPVIVNVEWFRHWPAGRYVTSGDASHMRR